MRRRLRFRRDEKGSAILGVTMVAAAFGLAMYMIPDILSKYESTSENERYLFESRMLARDLVEVGKYLTSYERVVFIDRPTKVTAARLEAMKQIWASAETASGDPLANEYFTVCSGYDTTGVVVNRNTLRLAGGSEERVFCPFVLRSNRYGGRELENIVLNSWTRSPASNPILTTKTDSVSGRPSGVYRLEIDFTDALDLNARRNPDPDHFLLLNTGQKLLNSDSLDVQASVIFEIYGTASGYGAKVSERYVKITSRVKFNYRVALGLKSRPTMVTDDETIMIVPSTPKDFALFLLYTYGTFTAPRFQTPLPWKDNVVLSPASGVHGRTFYRGPIVSSYEDFRDLPQFHDVVVLDGNLSVDPPGVTLPEYIPTPTQQNIERVRAKFEKGVLPNFSARRLLVSGGGTGSTEAAACGPTQFTNQSNYPCIHLAGIHGAISPLSPHCSKGKWIVSGEGAATTCATSSSGAIVAFNGICVDGSRDLCDSLLVTNLISSTGTNDALSREKFVTRYAHEIELKRAPYSFIFAATSKLAVTQGPSIGNETHVYGTVLGGAIHMEASLISAGHGLHFYSVSNWREDLPGMVNPGDPVRPLDATHERNVGAGSVQEVVAAPLTGMPVIWSSREGMR